MKQEKLNSGIFSKDYQNELKHKWEEGIKEVWGKDSSMVDWEMKQVTYIVPICGGKYMVELTKPHIETEFYFGYSDCGQGMSFEDNNKRMNYIELTKEDYFMNKNLNDIDNTISKLKEVINGSSNYKVKHYVHYTGCPDDSVIHGFCFESPYYGNSVSGKTWDLDIKDIQNILNAYELHRERFVKRLNAYLKRFGGDKLRISSYWIDR